jgi:hypothetical protein
MRSAYQTAIICAGLAALSGCQDKKPADRAEAAARVEAALQINDPTQRDKALASACTDAAEAGASEVVVKGVRKIGDPTRRDQVAEDCALKLRDSGQTTAANDVAKLIGDPTKRDGVLRKLASGS